MLGRGAQYFGEVLEMCAERRKAGQDRLLVSNVGVDVVENRDSRSRIDRSWNPRLHQGGKQTQRLEQHCFAAGVRSGNEQRSFVRRHLEVERNDVDPLGYEERVSTLDEIGRASCRER